MEIEIIDCQQGSEEWKQARVGIVTCSELAKVLAKGQGLTRGKYMRQLAGEIVTGNPAYAFQGNAHTERGKEEEPKARELAEIMVGQPISEVGFIKNHTLRLGCSPDGLVGDDTGLEIKSVLADIQVERLFHGGLPSDYRAQVEGSLLATGREKWKFLSYSPMMPPLFIEVALTDERREVIEAELRLFNEELDEMVERVKGYFHA